MKTIGSMMACALLAACGGSSKSAPPAAPAPAESEPEVNESLETGMNDREVQPDPMTDAAFPAGPPVPAVTEPAARVLLVASADVRAVEGDDPIGVVTFEEVGDGSFLISGDFSGLGKERQYAFIVHENGDCSAKGKHVGGHLNPTKAKHGPPSSSERHAGDFGDLTTDAEGKARFSMKTDSITMEHGRADSVLERTIVIHTKKDSKQGNVGGVLACGVIQLVEGV